MKFVDLIKTLAKKKESGFEERMSGETIEVVENQCHKCKHLNRGDHRGVTCKAFPDAIPTLIFLGIFDHTAPWYTQTEDDGGVRYEPFDNQS